MDAAKKKSLSPAGLAVLRVLLLLVVTLFLPQTRVWGFEAAPQHASGKIAFASASAVEVIAPVLAYDASDCRVAADTAVPQILENNATGKAAEALAKADLEAQGYTVIGSNVTARTSVGIRYIDHLVDVEGDLFAVEVKSGGAVRNGSQLLKDTAMEMEGATLSGPNVPANLQGQTFNIPTVEMHYP